MRNHGVSQIHRPSTDHRSVFDLGLINERSPRPHVQSLLGSGLQFSPLVPRSAGQREVLESLARSQSGAHREVVGAKALLMAADGMANTAIATALSVSPASVKSWRDRFAEEGLAKLGRVRAGRGRKKSIPQDKIDEIVDLTLNYR